MVELATGMGIRAKGAKAMARFRIYHPSETGVSSKVVKAWRMELSGSDVKFVDSARQLVAFARKPILVHRLENNEE